MQIRKKGNFYPNTYDENKLVAIVEVTKDITKVVFTDEVVLSDETVKELQEKYEMACR